MAFADPIALRACHDARINGHRVTAGLAARGKTSTGRFHGFKLNLVIDGRGRLVNACVTPGNVDDRGPVPRLTEGLFGKPVVDKGYASQALFEQPFRRGLHLVTRIKSNVRTRPTQPWDKLLLGRRTIIESAIDQPENVCRVEHPRPGSPAHHRAEGRGRPGRPHVPADATVAEPAAGRPGQQRRRLKTANPYAELTFEPVLRGAPDTSGNNAVQIGPRPLSSLERPRPAYET